MPSANSRRSVSGSHSSGSKGCCALIAASSLPAADHDQERVSRPAAEVSLHGSALGGCAFA